MSKFSSIIIFVCISIISVPLTHGAEEDEACEVEKDGYELYNCRIKHICEIYKPKKPTFKTQSYKKAETLSSSYIGANTNAPAVGEAKKMYRDNIGSIYKCAMIQAQKNALEFLKKQLKSEKTGAIDDTIGRQIEQRNNKLDLTANTLKCSFTEKDKFIIKENLLNETTFEMCKYINYLEYLRKYYSDNETSLGINNPGVNNDFQTAYDTKEIPKIIAGINAEISNEISHTYKVFPLVFHAYSEYENNFPIHFMLEIIHADFLLLKQKMYQVIMPIAQVGYKIINAMSH